MTVSGVSDVSAQSLSYDKPNISDIILTVGLESMKASENKLDVYYKQMQQTNRKMQNLNAAMAIANTNASNPSANGVNKEMIKYINLQTGDDKKQGSVYDVMRENGIPLDKVKGLSALDKGDWSALANQLKLASDNLGSTSQMEMMKMQSVVNKLNEVTQAISNNMNKFNQMMMAVIGNMR